MASRPPIPVSVAADVAKECDQNVVLIYAENDGGSCVISFGVTPEQKVRAAALADRLNERMQTANADIANADFRRHEEAAVNKWKVDQLLPFVMELATRTTTGERSIDILSEQARELVALLESRKAQT